MQQSKDKGARAQAGMTAKVQNAECGIWEEAKTERTMQHGRGIGKTVGSNDGVLPGSSAPEEAHPLCWCLQKLRVGIGLGVGVGVDIGISKGIGIGICSVVLRTDFSEEA